MLSIDLDTNHSREYLNVEGTLVCHFGLYLQRRGITLHSTDIARSVLGNQSRVEHPPHEIHHGTCVGSACCIPTPVGDYQRGSADGFQVCEIWLRGLRF